ncbi:MAG: hypothetical protein ACK5LY_05530 [Lachnospirales bacterium]
MDFIDNKIIVKIFGECNKEKPVAKGMYICNIVIFISVVLITIYDFYFMLTTTGFNSLNFLREVAFIILIYGVIRITYKRMWSY